MSQTATELQTQLAYRLGETAAPTDATTLAIRLEWINQAYMMVARRRNWWWLEKSVPAAYPTVTDTNINTGSTTGYAEPTDLKEFIELKVGDVYYDQKPFNYNRDDTNRIVSLPSVRVARDYYRFGGRYYFSETDAADSEAHYIKYWRRVVKVVAAGTFLIPDEYLDGLVAYAEGRYWLSISQQSKAQVPFQEFEEVVKEMTKEQGRRGMGHKLMSEIREPEEAYY